MFFSRIKSISIVKKSVRLVSQFRLPMTDCSTEPPPRHVVDPASCAKRDQGLVLGVYYSENVLGEPAILTATAQKFDEDHGGKLWQQLKLAPIPRLGQVRVFYDLDPKFAFVAVAGLGSECLAFNKKEKMDESKEAIRIAAGIGAQALTPLQARNIYVESFGNSEAAAEGASLAIWKFTKYRSVADSQIPLTAQLHLYEDCDFLGWKSGIHKAESQNLVRYLQEMPANLLNPTSFAKIAVDLLCELNINVEVRTKGWAASHDMGGFEAISKSSVQPPLYVEISYYGAAEKDRPVVMIGKGVTFDSGSIDLKSCEELRYMKGDMAGAACVLAIVRCAAMLKLPVNLRGILPLCELMPNGKSPRHGDVVCSGNGKNVKIRLPSREGRLLISDSLVYARSFSPRFIVDIGTMSKEMMVALGGAACGCYANDEELFNFMEKASGQTGDRIWRMPLWKFYENRVNDTQMADVANTGRHIHGDSPNCAAFLKQFISDSRWMHLDTYNVAYTKGCDFPYLGRGMTGRPTRTVIELIYQLLAAKKL